jgi:hypothetical protein
MIFHLLDFSGKTVFEAQDHLFSIGNSQGNLHVAACNIKLLKLYQASTDRYQKISALKKRRFSCLKAKKESLKGFQTQVLGSIDRNQGRFHMILFSDHVL